jgi:Peptidase family S41
MSSPRPLPWTIIPRSRISWNFILLRIAICSLLISFQTAAQQLPNSTWGDANREKWLDDFHQLLDEMSSHYANLEFAITSRRMDLPKLKQETERRIKDANDEDQERRIFQNFLDTFGDGHLGIRWPRKPESPSTTPSVTQTLCDRLGYINHRKEGIDFSLLPDFHSLDDPGALLFPGGILSLQGMPRMGTVRIANFGETGYPEACQEAVQQLHISTEEYDACKPESQCEEQVRRATGNLLTREVVRRIASLQKAGAQRILIDITNNDGGSDWVQPVVRSVSTIALEDMRIAFIKNPHWAKDFRSQLVDVEADLKAKKQPEEILRSARTTLQKAIALSEEKCNLSSVWTTSERPCSLLAPDLIYFSGLLPYAKPDVFSGFESRSVLFHPLWYTYAERQNSLPVVVLVNGHTWSSAEYFAAILQDNKAAQIIGQLTGGAGCGYTNGGIPVVLKNSGAQVKMPDCVRLRADGSNEVVGITPDVLVPWADRDSPFQRAHKLEVVLRTLK